MMNFAPPASTANLMFVCCFHVDRTRGGGLEGTMCKADSDFGIALFGLHFCLRFSWLDKLRLFYHVCRGPKVHVQGLTSFPIC